jgi:uncharacterized protein (TIGR03435 family)
MDGRAACCSNLISTVPLMPRRLMHSLIRPEHPIVAPELISPLCRGKSISTAQLATSLIPFVGRFVVDKTGLPGRFDVELTWTDQAASSDAVPADSGPSIFSALQEQLGLKLVSEQKPVEVLLVDHAEEPVPE